MLYGGNGEPFFAAVKFARLFHNSFLEPSVSHGELVAFATETKANLVSDNGSGSWDGLVAGITGALSALSAATVADGVKLGRRKGAKLTKRKFRRELPGKAARIYGAVLGHYGSRTGELLKVFPRGRRGLVRTPDDLLASALGTLVNALALLAPEMGDMGTTALGLAQELQTGWAEVYGVSEASTGEKAAAEAAQRGARVMLGAQLHLALLSVTAHFVSEAAAQGKVLKKKEAAAITARYFRQDLLKDRTRRKGTEGR